MRIEIIRPDGDLKREVWSFTLYVNYSQSCIYFNSYYFQTKESKRKRNWTNQSYWTKFFSRESNIPCPNIPQDIQEEIHNKYAEYVKTLPIKS